MLLVSSLLLLCANLTWIEAAAAGGERLCLPDGIPADERKNITVWTTAGAQSMPIGVWKLDWASASLVGAVYTILTSEVLGYNVATSGASVTSRPALYALAGCEDPHAAPDGVPARGDGSCGLDVWERSPHHVALEFWYAIDYPAMQDALANWTEIHPSELGTAGYEGFEGMFVLQRDVQLAMNTEGLALEYYRSYNGSWNDLGKYFSRATDIDPAQLLPCAEGLSTRWHSDNEKYITVTGDNDGMEVGSDGDFTVVCTNNSWWVGPACRERPERCIPVVTGGPGWGVAEMMQKAAYYNMPLAIATAAEVDGEAFWATIPRMHHVLLFGWIPDVTFVELYPQFIFFPRHDPQAWARGELTSASTSVELNGYAWNRLIWFAPRAFLLAQNLKMDINAITSLLLTLRGTAEGVSRSPEEAACHWLLDPANIDLWGGWIREPTFCPDGHGLISDFRGDFRVDGWAALSYVDSRANAMTCFPCEPGRYSIELADDWGVTRLCALCAPGSEGPLPAVLECNLCQVGTFSHRQGQTECSQCETGRYANSTGLSICFPCPRQMTTIWTATESESDCKCINHMYMHSGGVSCGECPQGMRCSGGLSDLLLQPGFMSLSSEPTEVFTCANPQNVDLACPGERVVRSPNMCGEHLDPDLPRCAVCFEGFYLASDGLCRSCDDSGSHWILYGKIILFQIVEMAVLLRMYLRYNRPNPSGMITLSLLINYIQGVQQILRLPGLAWPPILKWVFNCMNLITFRSFLNWNLSLQCFTGNHFSWALVADIIAPFTVVANFLFFTLAAKIIRKHMYKDHMINTIALVYKGLFITIASSTLGLFITETMPNGKLMVKIFPEIEYGSSEWWNAVPLSGAAFCICCLSFLTFVTHAVWMAPRMAATWPGFVERYRFAFGAVRPDRWWWALVQLMYCLNLAIVQVISYSVHFRIYLMTFLLIIYVSLCSHVRPWKFLKNNFVDISLQYSLLLFLIVVTSFVQTELLNIDELDSSRKLFEKFAIVLLAVGVAHSIQGFVAWLVALARPNMNTLGRTYNLAMEFRDLMLEIFLLPDRAFIGAVAKLSEMDQQRLRDVMCTMVPMFL